MLLGIMADVPGARWQDDAQLHLTLRFVGEVDGRMAEDVALTLSGVRAKPFEIALDGVGGFDRRGRIDALWAGVRPHEPLAMLHRKIDAALVRIGLPPEGRAYLPHITLARFGRAGGAIDGFAQAHGGLTSAPFAVADFHLFESTLGGEGARYERVARYALA